MNEHRPDCVRGWFDKEGWHEGDAPAGFDQFHSAICESPEENLVYARYQAFNLADKRAVPFDKKLGSLAGRTHFYGLAMAEWIRDHK